MCFKVSFCDIEKGKNNSVMNKIVYFIIRINQLPVSATMWLNGSQICFATSIQCKITILLIAQQTLKLKKKNSADLETLEIKKKFDICTTNFKTDQNLSSYNQSPISTENQDIYWVKPQILKGTKIDCLSFVMCPLIAQLIIGFFFCCDRLQY